MSLKIVFMLAFLAVAFALPSTLKKKPTVEVPKKLTQVLQKSSDDLSEGVNDEINFADYDDVEVTNEKADGTPLRIKRASCRYIKFRTKSGKVVTVYKCN